MAGQLRGRAKAATFSVGGQLKDHEIHNTSLRSLVVVASTGTSLYVSCARCAYLTWTYIAEPAH